MRELKFRAWGKNGKMYDRVLAGPGDPCSIVWSDKHDDWVHFDEVSGTIMQYTGVHDKNGREIYEGDIVRGYDKHVGFNVPPTVAVVVWNRQQLAWRLDGVSTATKKQASIKKLSNIEVIGNIYENPDLISADA